MSDYPPPSPGAYPPQPPPPPEGPEPPGEGMSTRAKVILGTVAAVIVLVGIGVAVGGGDDHDETSTVETTTTAEPDDAETTERPTTTEEPTTTTTQPEGPPTLAIGETLHFSVTTDFDDIEFSDTASEVDVTLANPATFTEEPVEFGSEPQNGVFLVLDATVVVAPDADGTYSAGPFEFKFVAADGTAADTAFALGFEPELPTINLSAGQRVAGKIVFDINPAQQAGAKIQINDTGEDYGEPFAYWAL